MSNSSIWTVDRIRSGASTQDQSGRGCDGNEVVLRIPQSSSITGASPSDCFTSYPEYTLVEGLTLSRDAVSIFYCPSRLVWMIFAENEYTRYNINMKRPNHSHHHHVVLVARISLTLSRHFSLSFIASGRSSGQHPVSSHSCWMYVRAGRPAFARPYVGVH